MYFPVLKNAIQNAEEKLFYSIALMYLTALGYRDVVIIDGTGDGGRDVSCSRKDLRIQLSVRRSWEDKINEEADLTSKAGKSHLIYVTQRSVSEAAEQKYLLRQFRFKGIIDVSIHDLNRVSSTLAQPGVIQKAYELLGMRINPRISATPKEVALSTMLLFSQEAKDLRNNVVEAHIRAWLYKNPRSDIGKILKGIEAGLAGVDLETAINSAVSRLRTAGRIVGTMEGLRLSRDEAATIEAAEAEYKMSATADVANLRTLTGLSEDDCFSILNKALELLARKKDLAGKGALEEEFRRLLAEKGLMKSRHKIYGALAKSASAKHFSYGNTIENVFSANTFDIYRALGGRTDLTMILDTSVALPMMFGLEFAPARSRYSVAATALQHMCKEHNLKIVIPRAYLNEMASHGIKALEYLQVYPALPTEAKAAFKSSGNAYLSHFSFIDDDANRSNQTFELKTFLEHYGIRKGRSIRNIENRIQSLAEAQGVEIIVDGSYLRDIRRQIAERKPHESGVVIDHDARVCSMLTRSNDKGYIFATWDNVIIDVVEDLARVYSDTPARIIDFLSLVRGADYECEVNIELLSTLLHIDEDMTKRFASQVEKIKSVEQAFRLQSFVDNARRSKGDRWSLTTNEMSRFLTDDIEHEVKVNDRPSSLTEVR